MSRKVNEEAKRHIIEAYKHLKDDFDRQYSRGEDVDSDLLNELDLIGDLLDSFGVDVASL